MALEEEINQRVGEVRTETIDGWILHEKSQFRLFGISKTDYRKLSGKDKDAAKKDALKHFEERYQDIFQRRNDCIHNCDRQKIAPQKIGNIQVVKVIKDVEFLVSVCHETFLNEFPLYLEKLGFTSITKNFVLHKRT